MLGSGAAFDEEVNSCLPRFKNVSLSSEKIETLLVVVVFLVSLAYKNKSVKLKKRKHKKSNVSRISVKERKREKYGEKNYQPSIHSSP